MTDPSQARILCVDDDTDSLAYVERVLTNAGYDVATAEGASQALEVLRRARPDLILLDIVMPGVDGYALCAEIHEKESWARIPVVFLTALDGERDKARALSAGAVEFLSKPLRKEALLEAVRKHVQTGERWDRLVAGRGPSETPKAPSDFRAFKEFLTSQASLSPESRARLAAVTPSRLYETPDLGIDPAQLAKLVAQFLRLPYVPLLNPDAVELGVLPVPFCRTHRIVAIREREDVRAFVLANPFDHELLDLLRGVTGEDPSSSLRVASAGSIDSLLAGGSAAGAGTLRKTPRGEDGAKRSTPAGPAAAPTRTNEAEKPPVLDTANRLLQTAVDERASDIHIEPKGAQTVIRLRIDGEMRDVLQVDKATGLMLISRFKALSGMDIAERRRPQDGALEFALAGRNFKLRMATSSTPSGESLVIRLLEPDARPKSLLQLGMSGAQVAGVMELAEKTRGLILFVGPTGSGKTTTIYSLLSQIDCASRSLMSVEDPVEYLIALANQQQVNEKAGISFQSLLKSAVRQDPDILFIGEIRDSASADIAVDFASTGHLTITTLHTSNAITALFRLDRLGIYRGTLADIVLGIVAQRLIRLLCPHCKRVDPISKEEARRFAPFCREPLSEVAHPVGCSQCNGSGYRGRDGVFEVVRFDPEIAERVRSDMPISEIRKFARNRGDFLIGDHVVEKVRRLDFSPRDAYENVLAEETEIGEGEPKKTLSKPPPPDEKKGEGLPILVVEDDEDNRSLMKRLLENRGCRVVLAEDGIEALLRLGREDFRLILSDINMPNLDGWKLMEMLNQKGIRTPVIFVTGRADEEDEIRGLKLGAIDYVKKPIKKDLFLLKIQKHLERPGAP